MTTLQTYSYDQTFNLSCFCYTWNMWLCCQFFIYRTNNFTNVFVRSNFQSIRFLTQQMCNPTFDLSHNNHIHHQIVNLSDSYLDKCIWTNDCWTYQIKHSKSVFVRSNFHVIRFQNLINWKVDRTNTFVELLQINQRFGRTNTFVKLGISYYASRRGVSDFKPIPDPQNEPWFSEASTLLIDRTSPRWGHMTMSMCMYI